MTLKRQTSVRGGTFCVLRPTEGPSIALLHDSKATEIRGPKKDSQEQPGYAHYSKFQADPSDTTLNAGWEEAKCLDLPLCFKFPSSWLHTPAVNLGSFPHKL